MSAYIDINDDHELYIWARTFGITPDELVRLVSEVGSSPVRVRDALKRAEIARSSGRFLPEGSKPAARGSKSSSD